MNDDSPPSAIAEGHRERMRTRFLAGDDAALSDEALLELLLSYSIPRRDVKPLAQMLLARFGDIASVLAAGPADLKRVSGIKENSVVLLKLAARLSRGGGEANDQVALPAEDRGEGGKEIQASADDINAPEAAPYVAEQPESRKAAHQPKLQISGGYILEPAQLASLLTVIQSKSKARKISAQELVEGSGLSARQVENLVSMGAALGLITPRKQILTAVGSLIVKHDIFLGETATLEFCHFLGAGNPRNLIWFMVFNDLLATQKPTDQPGWSAWLRGRLAGQYSERSLAKHLAHEVRFLLDAYTAKNFKKLGLLTETPDKAFALRRYTALLPLTLAAMIYLLGNRHQARLVPFTALHAEPGSPGRVFGLDAGSMRQMVETLHQKGWVRFEVRHGLDQVRLVEGFEPLEFLAAAYENRSPQPTVATPDLEAEPQLL